MNKVPKELMMEIPVNCWTDFLMEFEEVLEKVAGLEEENEKLGALALTKAHTELQKRLVLMAAHIDTLHLKLVDMQIQNDMLQTNLESLKKEFQDDSTDRFARIPP